METSAQGSRFIAINYEGFNQDICKAIEEYDKAVFGGQGSIVCEETDGDYVVYTQGDAALELWKDLTAKIRIQGEYHAANS